MLDNKVDEITEKIMKNIHRKRGKNLGVLELVAIALGGMIGVFTPLAFIVGG